MPAKSTRKKADTTSDGPSLVREAMVDGAEDARRAMEEVGPIVSETVSNLIYGAAYGVSFGSCLAALTVSRVIPRDSTLAKGATHGFEAAREKIDSFLPPSEVKGKKSKASAQRSKRSTAAAQRARGEVTATAMRITEDTSVAHG